MFSLHGAFSLLPLNTSVVKSVLMFFCGDCGKKSQGQPMYVEFLEV